MTSVWKEKQELQGLVFDGEEVTITSESEIQGISESISLLEEAADENGMIEMEESDIEQIESMQEELKSFSSEMQEKFDDLTREGYDLETINKGISELVELNKDNAENREAVGQLKTFLAEMEEVNTFEPLIKSVGKIKNKEKIHSLYVSNFENSLTKLTKKIKENRVYTFIKPNKINIKENTFVLLGDMDDSMLFLYVFFGFASQQKNLTKHALFINEVLRQIKHVDKLKEEEKDRLITNMRKVLSVLA